MLVSKAHGISPLDDMDKVIFIATTNSGKAHLNDNSPLLGYADVEDIEDNIRGW